MSTPMPAMVFEECFHRLPIFNMNYMFAFFDSSLKPICTADAGVGANSLYTMISRKILYNFCTLNVHFLFIK